LQKIIQVLKLLAIKIAFKMIGEFLKIIQEVIPVDALPRNQILYTIFSFIFLRRFPSVAFEENV